MSTVLLMIWLVMTGTCTPSMAQTTCYYGSGNVAYVDATDYGMVAYTHDGYDIAYLNSDGTYEYVTDYGKVARGQWNAPTVQRYAKR